MLVHIVDNLGMPDVVKFRDGRAGFRLRENIPVAIVIVADIFVIEFGRVASLELRA